MSKLPIKLSQVSGIPFYKQIVDQMSALIRSGRLTPDTQLPSLRDLSGQLLVSLITTRRAYAELESAGLIVRRQGQGTFVAEAVGDASRKKALREARNVLGEALERARALGLEGEELRIQVMELLGHLADGDEK